MTHLAGFKPIPGNGGFPVVAEGIKPDAWHRFPVVLTANLPVAGTSMNGVILIEDAGTGDRNLVFYASGQRFRVDGGANV